MAQHSWSQPVSSEIIEAAKNGCWQLNITKKSLPKDWLPQDIKNKKILCLAAAGGQQAPILAAAGAEVTVFDLSEEQLALDRQVAAAHNLSLVTIQGDMSHLAGVNKNTFDYIIHPISNLYVADLDPVWQECFRVLRPGGGLLASFYNPALFIFSRDKKYETQGLLKPEHVLPYADHHHLAAESLRRKIENHEALVFGHTLTQQIHGQLEAGFLLSGFYEDEHPSPRFLIENYMKPLIATRAIKPK